MLTSGMGVWQRRGVLLKLSGQTQLLEELAEISVDRLGAVTSAADGTSWQLKIQSLMIFFKKLKSKCQILRCTMFLLPVLPSLAERPQLMTLWSECSGSAGLFHTTLDRVFKYINQLYSAVLQERHPHSTHTGRHLTCKPTTALILFLR